MNIKSLFSAVAAIVLTASMTSCLSDGDESILVAPKVEKPSTDTRTVVVTTENSARISHAGYSLYVPAGAVPRNTAGEAGKVAFSMSQAEELPAPLPSNVTPVNSTSVIKAEPMGFVFNSPLTMTLPTDGLDLDGMTLLHFNEYTGAWEVVPFSAIAADGTVSVSVLDLGYYAMVYSDNHLNYGGIHISSRYLDRDYFYYLTVTNCSSSTATKSLAFSANGQDLYMSNLPTGSYNLSLARERKSSVMGQAESVEYLSSIIDVTVSTVLTPGNSGYESYRGWTEVTLGSASWVSGRPSDWGTVTTTYGTGKFQATLTWVNATDGTSTDYDLHLYGPDLHVYFSNSRQGAFELDRDWTHPLGNAIENIYSVDDNITPGDYEVRVYHFSGMTGKRYNCRVIIDGVVVKSVTGSIYSNKSEDIICSFSLE